MTASRRLRGKLELAAGALDAAAVPVWQGADAAALYPQYLAALHGVARGAVPLMEAALARCRALAGGDDVAAGLAPFLERHIPEEAGHDDWLLDDIAALGGDPAAVRERLPGASVAAMNGAQLWWIEHAHPVALLGHAEVLEGFPPDPAMLDQFQRETGLPDDGLRFFRRHAEIDLRHRDEIHACLDGLPLDAGLESLIGTSALHTTGMLVRLYAEVARAPAESSTG